MFLYCIFEYIFCVTFLSNLLNKLTDLKKKLQIWTLVYSINKLKISYYLFRCILRQVCIILEKNQRKFWAGVKNLFGKSNVPRNENTRGNKGQFELYYTNIASAERRIMKFCCVHHVISVGGKFKSIRGRMTLWSFIIILPPTWIYLPNL